MSFQVQGFDEARRPFGQVGHYSGVIDCFTSVVRQEGITSFYKGGTPALIKVNQRFLEASV